MIKSILVGLVAMILTALVSLVSLLVKVALFVEPKVRGPVGIDPVSIVRSQPWTWIAGLAAFCLGFYWEYRRVRAR